MHRPVVGLPGERLQVDRAVRVAIEEAAELVLELVDALDGGRDQGPGELLIVEPLPALDGVHEMALDRIAGPDRDVVPALHHPRAAALPQQALDRHGDVQVRRRLVGVERGEQPGAAAPQDQDVGLAVGDCVVGHPGCPSSGGDPVKVRS